VAYGLRGEVLVWLIGAVVGLLAANRGSSCSLTRAMDGRLLRCGIISLCQSAATSNIVKRLVLSPSCVRSAIASTGLYLYLLPKRWDRTGRCIARVAAVAQAMSVALRPLRCVLCVAWKPRFTANFGAKVMVVISQIQ